MHRLMAAVLALSLMILPVRAAEEKKYVALTFDDGPSGKYTQTLLDGLDLRGAKATFFLCGYRMEQYPALAQRIFDEGHEIGYHGFSHKNMPTMSRRSIAAELMDSQALLPEDCDPVFFRPPGGLVSDGVRQVAQARNLKLLSWSVDPKDWETENTVKIEQKVLEKVSDGDIVLLHDMTYSSVKAALNVVDALQAQGYRFVTVSELVRLRRVRLRDDVIYRKFPPETEPVK